MAKALITIGVVLLIIGLAWPFLSRMGLGRLPGDFLIHRNGFTFYFPLTSSILVSLAISFLIWLFRK